MRRIANFLLRNWPLKLGAVLLATVLYSGLVLSQSVRTWTGSVPVDGIRPPPSATLLSAPEPVTLIRYRAPVDVGVISPDSFRATVDLSRVVAEADGPPVSVPVALIALDRRIEIVDFVPQTVEVRLDPVEERQVPVDVTLGAVPQGLELGTPQVVPLDVTVRGASSRVAAVRSVAARVPIDASALNVDRDVELVAVDADGNQVPNVQLEPPRARVRITVARQLANRTVPIVPDVVGEPAVGYQIESVSVEPLTVTVNGEEPLVTRMESVRTDPIDVTGREHDFEAKVPLSLPAEVNASGVGDVSVTVTIAPVEGSRTYPVAVVPVGARSDRSYTLAANAVNVTLSGPVAQLAAVDAAQLTATVPVSDLDVGRHELAIGFTPPGGLELVARSPSKVVVVVQDLLVTPSPAPETGYIPHITL